jgi:hypothetical protein
MQKLLFLLAFVCLGFTSLHAQRVPKVEVFFQQYHTKDILMNIQAEMAAMDIILEYTHMAFDAEGRLKELKFTVDCKDGFKGSAATDNIPKDQSFGFVRDYRQDAQYAFEVGSLVQQNK